MDQQLVLANIDYWVHTEKDYAKGLKIFRKYSAEYNKAYKEYTARKSKVENELRIAYLANAGLTSHLVKSYAECISIEKECWELLKKVNPVDTRTWEAIPITRSEQMRLLREYEVLYKKGTILLNKTNKTMSELSALANKNVISEGIDKLYKEYKTTHEQATADTLGFMFTEFITVDNYYKQIKHNIEHPENMVF